MTDKQIRPPYEIALMHDHILRLEEEKNRIEKIMRQILLVPKDGGYIPAKNTSKEDCYMALGKIQELLGTNRIEIKNDR